MPTLALRAVMLSFRRCRNMLLGIPVDSCGAKTPGHRLGPILAIICRLSFALMFLCRLKLL